MISSESGEDAMSSEGAEDQMKPAFFLSKPDFMLHHSQLGGSHSLASVQYPYADPYYGGFLTSYGPQALMVGLQSTRVPLPLDLTDNGPIYVNAKQYHGILRRRQSRAKQEAQNKLIRNRKPYLHESRHLHALNRNELGYAEYVTSVTTCSDTMSVSDSSGLRFSGATSHMGGPCNAVRGCCMGEPSTVLQLFGETQDHASSMVGQIILGFCYCLRSIFGVLLWFKQKKKKCCLLNFVLETGPELLLYPMLFINMS
uniref:Nuclear transcription factor Y subunit n=1 Tax=Cannabis sativa TaxID=3483 RepID=A0A803NS53_CANSA